MSGLFKASHFRVTIFGSARIKKGDKTYKLIHDLAKRVGAQGIDIVTGGGPGLMDAANKGHHHGRKNNHTHSIGLNIILPKKQETNKHLDVKKEYRRFSHRLDRFMQLSNVVVVAPGGIGTLLELSYTWQLTQVKQICDIPIILLGDMWTDFLKWVKKWPLKKGFLNKEDEANLFHAKNNDEVMKIIRLAYLEYMNKSKNVCLNIKKYKLR